MVARRWSMVEGRPIGRLALPQRRPVCFFRAVAQVGKVVVDSIDCALTQSVFHPAPQVVVQFLRVDRKVEVVVHRFAPRLGLFRYSIISASSLTPRSADAMAASKLSHAAANSRN